MVRSMTGFGRYVAEEALSHAWEIRSVNSRYLDLKWRLPVELRHLENVFEKHVRRHAQRGRIEISLSLASAVPSSATGLNIQAVAAFSASQATAMLDALQCLALSRNEVFVPDYSRFLSIPSLWDENTRMISEEMVAAFEQSLEYALLDWNASRLGEGDALARDLAQRIASLENWVSQVNNRAPLVREERLILVRERLEEILAGLGSELEESRFLQEIVIMTDRLDVSEELTRLDAHFNRLKELLANGTDAGRRLDFTLQECFREINTCGNKIQDAHLSRLIVDCKNELEKCREQVQNLE